jgi:hypothetical protein
MGETLLLLSCGVAFLTGLGLAAVSLFGLQHRSRASPPVPLAKGPGVLSLKKSRRKTFANGSEQYGTGIPL